MNTNLNDKIKSHILSKNVNQNNRKLGIEVESILYDKQLRRVPIKSKSTFSLLDIIDELNSKKIDGESYSIEPGGQLEWASPPFISINDLNHSYKRHERNLNEILKNNEFFIIPFGLDPFYTPEEVALISDPKYQIMDKMMLESGSMGRWMMRNTASIQINFDLVNERDTNEILFISDCLYPISAYIFSNSPFIRGEKSNLKNIRNIVWRNTDNERCNNLYEHGVFNQMNMLNEYIHFIKNTKSIYEIDKNKDLFKSDKLLGDVLHDAFKKDQLSSFMINDCLRQIFTNVRLKNFLEIRGADRLSNGFELAPAAFWAGLFHISNRKELITRLSSWSSSERKQWDEKSFYIDASQKGPEKKSYESWNNWAFELALNGLEKRGYGESVFLEKYSEIIAKDGTLSLIEQKKFTDSGLSLKEHLFRKFYI